MKLHLALTRMLGLALSLVCISALTADVGTWPERPVRVVVPYSAGGGYDNFGRALAVELQQMWNQSVLVENRPGATEIIAAEHVKSAPPDGYTLFLASEVALITNDLVFTKLRYDPVADFSPVTLMLEGQLVYAVRKGLDASSMKEYLDLAKRSDGKLSYGSAGAGGVGHIGFEWIASESGVKLMHVPYKGAAPIMQDMLGEHVDSTIVPLGAIEPYLKAEQMRAIAVTGPSRLKGLPAVPTVTEEGYPSFDMTFFLSLVAPAGTPESIRRKIAKDVNAVIHKADFNERHLEHYGYIGVGNTPEEFAAFLAEDRERRRVRVEASGIKLD